jgi:hypothetical protein
LEQTGDAPLHAEPMLTHAPLALHICGCVPLHPSAPGLHATHASFRHAGARPVHGTGVPQAPPVVQVAMPLPEHSVWLGEHTPEHTPPTHVWLAHATSLPHAPLALHVSTALAVGEHCVSFGPHTPEHVPPVHV